MIIFVPQYTMKPVCVYQCNLDTYPHINVTNTLSTREINGTYTVGQR